MSAVSETIVREYFERHGFLVRQQRKYAAPTRREDEEFDFFVLNPRAGSARSSLPFIIESADMGRLARAVVAVKGWHCEIFSPGTLEHAPEIFRFVDPSVFHQAEKIFGEGKVVTKVLVMPALPQGAEAREQSVALLRNKGVDAVISFHTILADLIQHVEVNRNYHKSDLLQVLRILKNYDFFKEPQLELFRPRRRSRKPTDGDG